MPQAKLLPSSPGSPSELQNEGVTQPLRLQGHLPIATLTAYLEPQHSSSLSPLWPTCHFRLHPAWCPSPKYPSFSGPNLGRALTMCSVHASASTDKGLLPTGCVGRMTRHREGWRWSSGVSPRSLSLATPQAGLGHTETLGLLQLPMVNLQKASKWPAAKAP